MPPSLNIPPHAERISQILPTVKCSTCNQPVPISELESHTCATPPPVPSFRPPGSPRNTASLLSLKYQNAVTPRSQTPPQRTNTPLQQPPPPRQPSPLSPQTSKPANPTPPLAIGRPRLASNASIPGSREPVARPERISSASQRANPSDAGKVSFPSRPGQSESPRMPSPLSSGRPPHPSEPTRVATPLSAVRKSSEPSPRVPLSPPHQRGKSPGPPSHPPPGPSLPSTPAPRARAPSNASQRTVQLLPRQPTQSSPAPYTAPLQIRSSNVSVTPPAIPRQRAVTNAGPPPSAPPDIIYSTGNGPGPPSPLFDPRVRAQSSTSPRPHVRGSPSLSPHSAQSSVHYPPEAEIDTKSGGEAGMAGVGRRGFAAAARAAMFSRSLGFSAGIGMNPVQHGRDEHGLFRNIDSVQSMDGRRANAPTFLDITSAVNYGANTPPLSPNSASSRSPHSPLSAVLPSPSSPLNNTRSSVTPTPPAIVPRTPSPSGHSIRDRVIPPPLEPPKLPLPATPTSPRLPFFEKFRNNHPTVNTTPPPPDSPSAEPSPLSASSESSFGGLAYADTTDDESEEESAPVSPVTILRQPSPAGTITQDDVRKSSTTPTPPAVGSADTDESPIHFPSVEPLKPRSILKTESKYGVSSPRLPQRSLSASTTTSTYSVRSAAKSTGALDRVMETLMEEGPLSPTTASSSSPAMFPLALISDSQRDSLLKSPKLPTRSHTSPTLGRPDSRHGAGKRKTGSSKIKVCAKCEKKIEDGRWIQMDGGNVLCDRCWKNMYLPKCRRCNLTIEKQAVSSSDGQLKGKYHRECFNCHTCQKPFPDKSFYVFDGKPFCAYHYHEANDSLCAATMCGQPIEGPCAVSHTGDKYHPDHLVCEYSRCTERLVEYWEVDGRMLCDRHAQHVMAKDRGLDDDGEDEEEPESRATKRVTRFIDLAALNAGSSPKPTPMPSPTKEKDEQESELR